MNTTQKQRLAEALKALSPDERDVIRLHRMQKRDVDEVALIMGRTRCAIPPLYCRALRALGRNLGDESVRSSGRAS